jgi:hypothetical protein
VGRVLDAFTRPVFHQPELRAYLQTLALNGRDACLIEGQDDEDGSKC